MVILHGLLGSSRNWASAGKSLSSDWDVYALDLRNHGGSPHSSDTSFQAMAGDVMEWLDDQRLSAITLLGHSLGGKVAMLAACNHPDRIKALIVEDIAPKEYSARWNKEFDAMMEIDLQSLTSRQEAEDALLPHVPDWGFRKFLLSNIVRDEATGLFRWQCNLTVLAGSLSELFQSSIKSTDRFTGPVLVMRGGKSDYVTGQDIPLLKQHFPEMEMKTLPESGHNLHTEQPAAFCEALNGWASLNRIIP